MSKFAVSLSMTGLLMLVASHALGATMQYNVIPASGHCAPNWPTPNANGNTYNNNCLSTLAANGAQDGRICSVAGGYSNPTSSSDLYWEVDYQPGKADYNVGVLALDSVLVSTTDYRTTLGSGTVEACLIARNYDGSASGSKCASVTYNAATLETYQTPLTITTPVAIPDFGTIRQVFKLSSARTTGTGEIYTCLRSAGIGN